MKLARWQENRIEALIRKPGEAVASDESLLGYYAIRDQREVAAILGTSVQNVQQIERRCWHKIRLALSSYKPDLNR